MLTDLEIAQKTTLLPITEVAKSLGIPTEYLDLYGRYKAKLDISLLDSLKNKKDGKLILVTAISPTPIGEGKTTVTIGLGQAMSKIGKKAIITLREPSLGTIMNAKDGSTGGGFAQVVPMEDINLHFTGDFHAITTAHNLLSAAIDNHIYHGNKLRIDPRQVVWPRALDLHDRSMRDVVVGLGGKTNGFPREDSFITTAASEIMSVLCLSENFTDLKKRLGKIIFGYNYDGRPLTVKDLMLEGAMALLLKEAIKPNLVQTLENTPAIIHGGPFANIAHGCSSVIATKLALKLSDYVITEAGFGADLGAEKFFDIKCRTADLNPDAVVLVASVRALKYNGGVTKDELATENLHALKLGFGNLEKHIENLKLFGAPIIVALNYIASDSQEEVDYIKTRCKNMGQKINLVEVHLKGGSGGTDLAENLVHLINSTHSNFKPLYELNTSVKQKISKIATEIYGATHVLYSQKAEFEIRKIYEQGLTNLPICISKTQYSFTDNPNHLGKLEDFNITINDINICAGAGFIVAIAGDVTTMPGLPKYPVAEKIIIDDYGNATGLF